MSLVTVEVPMSAIAEYVAGISPGNQIGLGYFGGKYCYVCVRPVQDADFGTDNVRIEFDFRENGSSARRVTLSVFDIVHCEDYKRVAALTGAKP